MRKQTLGDQLNKGLRDLISAEEQVLKLLPSLSKGAMTGELRDTFRARATDIRQNIGHLKTTLKSLKGKGKATVCVGMKGIAKECSSAVTDMEKGTLRDAALIATMQRAELYKSASYDTMHEFAKLLGHDEKAELLKASWTGTDLAYKKLQQIAIQVNAEAYVDTHSQECPPRG